MYLISENTRKPPGAGDREHATFLYSVRNPTGLDLFSWHWDQSLMGIKASG